LRVLIVNENPLEKLGEDYYSLYSWIRFPRFLSSQFEATTLWSPLRVLKDARDLTPGVWRVEPGRLNIASLDPYDSFSEYYRLLPKRYFAWRRRAEELASSHDVVVLRAPSPIMPILTRAALKRGKPLVFIIAGDIEKQSRRVVGSRGLRHAMYLLLAKHFVAEERRFAKRASLVYAYSDELVHRHRAANGRVKLMRTPLLGLNEIHDRDDTCSGGEVRLLRVSWLHPSKGIECLLRAFSLLVRGGLDVHLEIAGRETAPGYQRQLAALAEGLGIAGRVTFSGWVPFDEMEGVYLRSDVQVISSLAEGTPRCIVEGAARGVPLVSTDAGGCGTFLKDRLSALLVPPENPEAIAGAVREIIADGPLRRRLIQGGYELARESTFERLGLRFVDEIKGVVGHVCN
jgi:glycosyltransferase involved in cell wall biosynthesis